MQTIWAIEKYEKEHSRLVNSWLYASEEVARAELPHRVHGFERSDGGTEALLEEWESESHYIFFVKRYIYETAEEARSEREMSQQYLESVRARR